MAEEEKRPHSFRVEDVCPDRHDQTHKSEDKVSSVFYIVCPNCRGKPSENGARRETLTKHNRRLPVREKIGSTDIFAGQIEMDVQFC